METWMVYGIFTALLLGASSLLLKLSSGPAHYNLNAHTTAILILLGIAAVFIPYYLIEAKFALAIPQSRMAITLAVASGILWALASIFLYKGFNLGADASRIVPLMNTNALVVVVLAVVLLHELPAAEHVWKTIAGASLILIGAILLG